MYRRPLPKCNFNFGKKNYIKQGAACIYLSIYVFYYTHSFSPRHGFVTGELASSCSRLGIKAKVVLLTSTFSSRSAFVESILAVKGPELSLKWTKKNHIYCLLVCYCFRFSFWENLLLFHVAKSSNTDIPLSKIKAVYRKKNGKSWQTCLISITLYTFSFYVDNLCNILAKGTLIRTWGSY